ncbi:MAG: pyridoxal phosphate biosynthetic protein PdxJ [Pseudobdellovibrio sp.]|jgi:pyridoxine 5-phosphate synthase|nr:pyridoxal phosphate biosynthetic protein PdxJ [Pseudobdellovibrio sp.]
MAKNKISLGVNIDHAATLRQVRGNTTAYPDLLTLVKKIKAAGGRQITIHLREDRRHIQDFDVVHLCKKSPLPINLEMAVSDEMLKIALKNKPAWVCFVPEKREELTTEGGLNVIKVSADIQRMTSVLKRKKIRSSYFIEPSLEQVKASADAGADAIEFHTGHWVLSKGAEKKKVWKQMVEASELAAKLNLRVHAGHGLDFEHCKLIRNLPHLVEVNIGHSIICYSLELGIAKATKEIIRHLK